jgi:Putative Ig domain
MQYFSPAPMSRGLRRSRLLSCVLLSIGVLAITAAPQAAADTSSYVQSASSFALPAGSASGSDWYSAQTACAAAGLCVSVGYTWAGSQYPLVVSFNDGQPGTATEVQLPPDADPTSQTAYLDGVSCQSASLCVAYGEYTTTTNPAPMVVAIVNGVPAQAQQVIAPANSVGTSYVYLNGASCPPSGNCVVVGKYESDSTPSDAEVPLVVDVTGGVPETGIEGAVPADPDTSDPAELADVACQADGSCTAVGSYYTAGGEELAYVLPLAGDATQGAANVALPNNASTTSPYASLDYVACPQSGTCEAVGTYSDQSSGDTDDLVVPINSGLPGTGSEIQQPANLASGNRVYVRGLSCSAASLCVAAGYYTDDSSSSNEQAALIPISSGGATAQESTLPADEWQDRPAAGWNAVSCIAAGPCLAAGYYDNSSSNQAGMVQEVSASGQIGSAVEAPVPADADPSGSQSEPYSVGCASSGSCVLVGAYNTPTTTDVPYVVSEQAPLTVSTSSLAGASQGSSYTASLAAAGAWGTYSWSVSSGSLPAGLGLNAQTGVISGTPSGSGTATFTVEATGTGSPVQTATEQLSLAVAATASTTTTTTTTTTAPPAVPSVRLLSASGKVSSNKLGVKLSCSGAACGGVVKVELSEVVTVKRGKKRVRKHETVVIGSAHYSIGAGANRTLEVSLTGAGKAALAKAKNHRLAVSVVATVTGGKQATRRETISAAVKRKKR